MDITGNTCILYLRDDSYNRKYRTEYTVDWVDPRIASLIENFVFSIQQQQEREEGEISLARIRLSRIQQAYLGWIWPYYERESILDLRWIYGDILLNWCLLTIDWIMFTNYSWLMFINYWLNDVYKLKVAFVNIDWHYYWIVILIWFLRSVFLRAEIYFLSLTPGVSYVPWTYNSYRRSAFFTWSTDKL